MVSQQVRTIVNNTFTDKVNQQFIPQNTKIGFYCLKTTFLPLNSFTARLQLAGNCYALLQMLTMSEVGGIHFYNSQKQNIVTLWNNQSLWFTMLLLSHSRFYTARYLHTFTHFQWTAQRKHQLTHPKMKSWSSLPFLPVTSINITGVKYGHQISSVTCKHKLNNKITKLLTTVPKWQEYKIHFHFPPLI